MIQVPPFDTQIALQIGPARVTLSHAICTQRENEALRRLIAERDPFWVTRTEALRIARVAIESDDDAATLETLRVHRETLWAHVYCTRLARQWTLVRDLSVRWSPFIQLLASTLARDVSYRHEWIFALHVRAVVLSVSENDAASANLTEISKRPRVDSWMVQVLQIRRWIDEFVRSTHLTYHVSISNEGGRLRKLARSGTGSRVFQSAKKLLASSCPHPVPVRPPIPSLLKYYLWFHFVSLQEAAPNVNLVLTPKNVN